MMLFGSTFVFTKIVYRHYLPLSTIFTRLVISASLLFIVIRFTSGKFHIQKEHLKYFLLLALFEPFLYFIGESFALQIVSSTISSVIIATIPVFTPIVAFFVLKEKLSIINIFGIIISFLGVMVLVLNKDLSLNAPVQGILLLFLAVGSAVFASVFMKILSEHYSTLTVIAYMNLTGAIYFLPLFLIFEYKKFIIAGFHADSAGALLYLAIFGSTIAFILFFKAVKAIGVSRSNTFSNTIPAFTAIFSFIILNELPTINKVLGMFIVITGVLLSQMKRNRFFKPLKPKSHDK